MKSTAFYHLRHCHNLNNGPRTGMTFLQSSVKELHFFVKWSLCWGPCLIHSNVQGISVADPDDFCPHPDPTYNIKKLKIFLSSTFYSESDCFCFIHNSLFLIQNLLYIFLKMKIFLKISIWLIRFMSCFMTIFGRIRVRTIWSDRDPTKKVRIRPDPYTQQCKTPLHTYCVVTGCIGLTPRLKSHSVE